MNRMAVVVLLAFSASMIVQTPQLRSGSTVYIEPIGGYETYLSAALVKKNVPLVVALDKDKAAYIIHSTIGHVLIGNICSETIRGRVKPIERRTMLQSLQIAVAELSG